MYRRFFGSKQLRLLVVFQIMTVHFPIKEKAFFKWLLSYEWLIFGANRRYS
jgi:hypothetical protein